MSDLTFYDAATPPANPPKTDGVAGYIGGDTPHIWTRAEWDAQPARYRLPIFVRSNPAGASASADAAAAARQLVAIGAPKSILVALDTETAQDPDYVKSFDEAMYGFGYTIIDYGSQSAVYGNDEPDGYYWGAEWTNRPGLISGDAGTQYASGASWDLDDFKAGLPFWDTKPPAGDWIFGPVRNLTVRPGVTSVALSWDSPSDPQPAAVDHYQITVRLGGADVTSYPREAPKENGSQVWQGGSLYSRTTYTALVRAVADSDDHNGPWSTVEFTTTS